MYKLYVYDRKRDLTWERTFGNLDRALGDARAELKDGMAVQIVPACAEPDEEA